MIVPDGRNWRSLPDRFDAQAAKTPAAVAIESETGQLTYAETAAMVDRRAAAIAERLRGGGRLVALSLNRTLDLPIWLLAVLRARAAYLPLDAAMPTSRTAQILADARPALVIADRSCLFSVPPTDVPVAAAEQLAMARAPRGGLPEEAAPDDLACILYTSGSTGRAKGVEIEHGSITAFFDAVVGMAILPPGGRMLAATRLSFDMSVPELLLPLTMGASSVVIGQPEAADPRRLGALLERFRPDVVQATPASFRALVEAGRPSFAPPHLLCGGEPMTPALAERLLPCCGRLWNVYGPTETTVWSTAHLVDTTTGPIPIGTPIAGMTLDIVDAAGRSVAGDEPGEIVIAGPGVARGYRGLPELTAGRFFALPDGRRAFRTGDIGHRDRTGRFHCGGRLDDQVKVRGFRVESGEVEGALAGHPEVAACAVRPWSDALGDTALVGYVVSRSGVDLPAKTLAGYLADRLPPYMIPDRFVAMKRLPLTISGKVDRQSLPRPVAVGGSADPCHSTMEALAAIWRDVLALPEVHGEDDFFELGGYSLLTVRLQRRIEERFGRVLELTTLMRTSTLTAMAALIDGDRLDPAEEVTIIGGGGAGRPPLFWLDAGPLVRGLAATMGEHGGVAALNLLHRDEQCFGDLSLDVAAVAAVLRKRLARAQPQGPVFLGGWCRWGVVAHELACQLRERGRTVGLLVLLDAAAPRPALFPPLLDVRRLFDGRRRPSEPPSFSQRIEVAARRHRARAFSGQALLLRPAGGAADGGGWRPHVGSLSIEEVPGDHLSMMRLPHVRVLGETIARHLDRGRLAPTTRWSNGARRILAPQVPVMPR